ncbi:MAG: hypothetical protein ACUVRK_07365 [Spirochaetota bacterium]
MKKYAPFLFIVIIIMIASCGRTQPEKNSMLSHAMIGKNIPAINLDPY